MNFVFRKASGFIVVIAMVVMLGGDVFIEGVELSLQKLQILAFLIGILLAGDAVVDALVDKIPFLSNNGGGDRGMVGVFTMLWATTLTAFAIAVYIQMVGEGVPQAFAAAYYVFGVGVLLVASRTFYTLPDLSLTVALLCVLSAEVFVAYGLFNEYDVRPPHVVGLDLVMGLYEEVKCRCR